MSTAVFDASSILSATQPASEKEQKLIAQKTEELSGLWFAILLTARWEAQETESLERRQDLQAELDQLRLQYYAVIDEVAMTLGVRQAMSLLESVERTVRLPKELKQAKGGTRSSAQAGEDDPVVL